MKKKLATILLSRYSLLALAVGLFALSFLSESYFQKISSVARERKALQKYINKLDNDFSDFVKDTSLLRKLIQDKEALPEFEKVFHKDYNIFLFAESLFGQESMLFWNSQEIEPPASVNALPEGYYFKLLDNGYYVIIKKYFSIPGMSNKLSAYALIPVQARYYLDNEALRNKFAYSSSANNKILISNKTTEYGIKAANGKTLFYIDRKTNQSIPYNDVVTIILRLTALLLFFIFSQSTAEAVFTKTKNAWKSVGSLLLILIIFRLSIYLLPFLYDFRQFDFFDPSVYGSNFINPTLGDLLINAILFAWITVFAWNKIGDRLDMLKRFNHVWQWIIGAISLLVLVLSTFEFANIIKSLVADSKISFDVTNFFSLSKFSVVGFIVLAALSLGYYHFSQLMFRFFLPVFEKRKTFIWFGIALTGLIYLSFIADDPAIQFYIPVLTWLIAYTWLVGQRGFVINRFRINIAGLIFWIFIFSISVSAIIFSENKVVEWKNRQVYAENIAEQNDESNERLMSTAITYLDNRFLRNNFYRFYNEEDAEILKDSIISDNFPSYLSKYDTRLYVFDSSNTGLFNDNSQSYETLNNIVSVQSKPSQTVDGLYSYVESSNKITYITKRVVTDTSGNRLGTFFIFSTPKKSGANTFATTLFKQKNLNDPKELSGYYYAIYEKGQLTESSNKYPFSTSLTKEEIPKQEVLKKTNGDFTELWYRDKTEKVIVMAKKKDSFLEIITLFSYIFSSFLFLITLIQVLILLVKLISKKTTIKKVFQLNIRTQVHGTFIFISIFSFFIIAIATISFFISRYNRNNIDKLSRTTTVMLNEMQKRIADHSIFDDVVKIYDQGSNSDLEKLVNEVADIHNVDVNIYDLKGNLQVTSEPNIYQKGVLSKKMNPEAYFHLSRLKKVERVQEESISDISYTSIYVPVRTAEDGKVYAYLNIPYFLSQIDLKQEISNFLVTIIILNAFIFLIAGVVALFITNRITRSFSLIGDKMKEVNLGKLNEEIAWSRNDEIGELVKEYNKMVSKLGESAEKLAKSEREGAWREMARQVAHEIKNPLTPMKLSIQYLQKAIVNNSPNVQELTGNVANTLVEQIDHLSKIAFDFSQFANIGSTNTELFDLHEVLFALKELYQNGQRANIEWQPVHQKIIINADRTQMNRLFTNLLQNAVEAIPENRECQININEKIIEGNVIISLTDNGEGIPEEMQQKIFVPNFTTKSSGTGLGLAMCKGIVEQAGGEISFDTAAGTGTTFHITLPLVD